MTAQPGLPWGELFELHVIKKVAKLVNRRWNLGLGYVDAGSGVRRPPQHNDYARAAGLCQVIQDCEVGSERCAGTAQATLERFRGDFARRQIRSRPITVACHAGLTEIAAPILIDGLLAGALLCGGFVLDDGGADQVLAEADARAAELGAAADRRAAALFGHPRISRRELSFIGELVEEAAAEIAAYLDGRFRRRPGELAADAPRERYEKIIGRAPAMQSLYTLLDKVAASDSTVLITGENGTGKELVARAIHAQSRRRDRRFVVQNCSAFNDNLLDSELFGHKRGAFTGAVTDKEGLFKVADQGTFFLDEIGDMSPSLQVKVLRVLQEGTFTAVGDTELQKVDVRIIAATNRDLEAMVERGEFREDLYYRINVINLPLPPLRERRGDVDLLVEHFLLEHAKGGQPKRLSTACAERLRAYSWPGNVRELENEIERAVVLSGDDPIIDESLLSPRIRQASLDTRRVADTRSLPDALRALERRMIRSALERNDWNKTRAAAELQISRRNLIRLVQKYELARDGSGDSIERS